MRSVKGAERVLQGGPPPEFWSAKKEEIGGVVATEWASAAQVELCQVRSTSRRPTADDRPATAPSWTALVWRKACWPCALRSRTNEIVCPRPLPLSVSSTSVGVGRGHGSTLLRSAGTERPRRSDRACRLRTGSASTGATPSDAAPLGPEQRNSSRRRAAPLTSARHEESFE